MQTCAQQTMNRECALTLTRSHSHSLTRFLTHSPSLTLSHCLALQLALPLTRAFFSLEEQTFNSVTGLTTQYDFWLALLLPSISYELHSA